MTSSGIVAVLLGQYTDPIHICATDGSPNSLDVQPFVGQIQP
ncbi:MAG: hypothetical protein O7F17_07360 [Planctomycetota bacterium]|nr:hypothetical protein [Planctomycetota bacterium]